MPTITINGRPCQFTAPRMILQVANDHGIEIPQYCYHDALSVVASCRICLGEVWAPNPRNHNALEPHMGGKLLPTCQTAAADGMVVYTDSPKAVQNQKAVMEYLLINHPLDCPVCDQSGECFLQDYSYGYGRSASRFEETKVKNPKKDVGPGVLLYTDRCIMCTRCVRFTREVTGTGELLVTGRGNQEEIDVFPGVPLDNELAVNVVDLCPVGALLEKDFLFTQRVWFLKSTPSIDGVTASGDNIWVHHNEGKVYRFKPRTNMAVNKWWISDEVRSGWKHVHGPERLRAPRRRQFGTQIESDWPRALADAARGLLEAASRGRVALMLSPMLACEEAYLLLEMARAIDPEVLVGLGPVPVRGADKTLPAGDPEGYRIYAEKAPNRRGVERVIAGVRGTPALGPEAFRRELAGPGVAAVVVTGNYPSVWVTDDLLAALAGKLVVLLDTLDTPLAARADVLLPGATWLEKSGTFENARGLLQSFEQAIPVLDGARQEAAIALALHEAADEIRRTGEAVSVGEPRTAVLMGGIAAPLRGGAAALAGGAALADRGLGDDSEGGDVSADVRANFAEWGPARLVGAVNAADVRTRMAQRYPALGVFASAVAAPVVAPERQPDMPIVEL
ncbi:MAG TPA: molybdopterin-dependent oxidoreductase [Phycisphaerales bacterium]|nr:molybdopterin-dependent oxidoreductase [Phycisphaerales bacterium]